MVETGEGFWRSQQNFHVYEEAFRASTPAPGSQLTYNTAGERASYNIGLAKARALDLARRDLIEAVHAKAQDAFGSAPPSNLTRSVDGVEGATDAAIKL